MRNKTQFFGHVINNTDLQNGKKKCFAIAL